MNVLRIMMGDLRRLAMDKGALIWLLAMPMLFAFIFGRAMGGGGQDNTWIPVVNLDHHELDDLFIDQLKDDGYQIDVHGPEDEPALRNKWPYGIVIPAGFADSILHGRKIKLTVVKGDGSPERIMDVQSRLVQAIVRFTKGLATADTANKEWNADSQTALKAALARPQLLTVARRTTRTLRPPPSGISQSLPGMLVMFTVQMILTFGGAALVKDRNGGQLARLFAGPSNTFEIYAGKILARVLLAIGQAVVLLVAGSILFKMPLGDHPLLLLPVIISLSVFAGCLSILGGVICKTEKQLSLTAIFGSMFLAALGGCWWPIEVVPDLFQTIAKMTPTYWGMHGLQSILYFGRSYEVLTSECPILIGFAVFAGALAVLATRRMAKGSLATGK